MAYDHDVEDDDLIVISGSGGKPSAPKEADDTLRSKATASFIELLGEGENLGLLDGAKSVFFDGTPLMNADGSLNFRGITIEERKGTVDQAPLRTITNSASEMLVNTTVRRSTGAVTRTTSNNVLDAARVRIQLPALYFVSEKGNIKTSWVSFTIEWRPAGGSWTTYRGGPITIQGKTSSPYEVAYTLPLSGTGPWDIRVTRIREDSPSSKYVNDLVWAGVTELLNERFTYPYCHILGVKVDTELFGGSAPTRSYHVGGRIVKVPQNFNPTTRTYSGIWNGTWKLACTDDPAWCYRDLLENVRYGLGSRVQSLYIDDATLYTISQRCAEKVPDGHGGQEFRFSANLVINTQKEAYDVLNDMASIFFGITYWSAGAVTLSHDGPAPMELLVTNSNVVGGEFVWTGTALSTRANTVIVAYNNPKEQYKQALEVEQASHLTSKYGYRPKQVTAFGCSSRGQARRLARWILYSEQMEDATVTYRAGEDHAWVKPGTVIGILDENMNQAKWYGRAVSYSGVTVKVDDIGNAALNELFTFSDADGVLRTRTITEIDPTTKTFTLASALPAGLPDHFVWAVQTADRTPIKMRVLSSRPVEEGVYEVTALKYADDKFAQIDNGLNFDDDQPTRLPTGAIPAPTNVSLVMFSEQVSGTEDRIRSLISWSNPSDVRITGYQVQFSDTDGASWREIGVTTSNSIEHLLDRGVRYQFRVRSLARGGLSSDWAYTANVTGRVPRGTISAVSALTANGLALGVQLTWVNPSDPSLKSLKVYAGTSTSFDSAIQIAEVTGNSYPHQTKDSVLRYYWVRSVSHNNPDSTDPATLTGPVVGAATLITPSELGEEIRGRIDDAYDTAVKAAEDAQKALTDANVGQDVIDGIVADVVGTINSDTAGIRGDLNAVQEDLAGVQTSVSNINGEIDGINTQIDDLATDTEASKQVLANLVDTAGQVRASALTAYYTKTASDAAIAAATSGLESKLTTNGQIKATLLTNYFTKTEVSSAISTASTNLRASMEGPGGSVAAAQAAAQAASDLAGSKGRVFVQTSAPTGTDRDAKNLWIDTTNGNNTPKRWSGSAWVAVTDKVAIDAAAAASAAQGKADQIASDLTNNYYTKATTDAAVAAASTALETKYFQNGQVRATALSDYYTKSTADSAIATATTNLKSSLEGTGGSIKAAQDAAQAASDLAGGKGRVFFQTAAPTGADRDAKNLWIDTTGNANTPKRWNGTAWVAVTDKVATDAAAAAAAATTAAGNVAADLSNNYYTKTAANEAIAAAQTTLRTEYSKILPGVLSDTFLGHANWGRYSTGGTLTKVANEVYPTGETWDFNITTASHQAGIQIVKSPDALWSGTKDAEAYVVEVEYTLVSGTLSGASVRLDWNTTDSTQFITTMSLESMTSGGGTGVRTARGVFIKPANFSGTFLDHDLYVFANYGSGGGTMATKRIKFHKVSVRVATAEELGRGTVAAAVQATLDANYYTKTDANTAISAATTNLKSTLEGTGGSIKAAQDAAQAASDLAGSKGRVFVQNAAPTGTDRDVKNLWIDTTGGANTPKRWNGSTWAAVTDKVATDAAAAASAAQGTADQVSANLTNNYYTKTSTDAAIAAMQLLIRADYGKIVGGVTNDPFLGNDAAWARGGSQGTLVRKDNEQYPTGKTLEFVVTSTQTDFVRISSTSVEWTGQTDAAGYVVEVEYELISGSLTGAQVRVDWDTSQATGFTVTKSLAEMSAGAGRAGQTRIATGIFQKPSNFTGTFSANEVYFFANWGSPLAAKRIKVHRINIRAATEEEMGRGAVAEAVQATLSASYYTKAEANSAISGAITNYDASLPGGVKASVTSTATAVATLRQSLASFTMLATTGSGQAAGIEAININPTTGAKSVSVVKLHGQNTIAQGTMTAAAFSTAPGTNLLIDPSFDDGVTHYTFLSQNGANFEVRRPGDSWAHRNYPTLYIHQPNAEPGGYSQIASTPITPPAPGTRAQGVPVRPGQNYTASVYVSCHRADFQLYLQWVDAAGNAISGAPESGRLDGGSGDSARPDTWPRWSVYGTAPANAVAARLLFRKYGTNSGNDSYVFLWKPQLEEAWFLGQEPGPWSPGGTTYISGGRLVNKSISSEKIDVDTLSAITANIGIMRTATSGERLEIRSNMILVYDASNTLRVRLGQL